MEYCPEGKIPSLRASRETERIRERSDRGQATATGLSLSSGREILATAMGKAGMWRWMM